MKRVCLLLALATAACAPAPHGGRSLRQTANPSAVIAADLAFNRLAEEKGQWSAFRETAAPDAEMFVPQRVKAAVWLKGRADPALTVRWSPQAVWSSCDGSYAVTSGPWTGPDSVGTFATVWQRQKDDGYKWVLDMSLTSGGATAGGDTIEARVAGCKRAPIPHPSTVVAGDRRIQSSTDGSLLWISHVRADGTRRFKLVIAAEGEPREVLDMSTGPHPDSPR